MKPPAAPANSSLPVATDLVAGQQTQAAAADAALSDEQLAAVAGGAVRAAVRPLLSSSPAFGALPPAEQKSIAKDL